MSERLIARFQRELEEASGWHPGQDPEPLLEVLSRAIALEATGALAKVSQADRSKLARLGRQALLNLAGKGGGDEEDRESWQLATALAREGLRALGGSGGDGYGGSEPSATPGEAEIASPRALRRLVAGELDGFASGSLALRILRSPPALRELRWLCRQLDDEEAAPPLLSLAASPLSKLRDPREGERVLSLAALGAEVFRFDDGRFAVYAEAPVVVRLEAPELITEDAREGYWLGHRHGASRAISARLSVGDDVVEVDLE